MAAKGFYLVQGDRTTCGGRITTGAEDHTLFDKPVAREQDSVTCGKHAGLYKIAGGIDNDTIHGRRMAGTLDSFREGANKQVISSQADSLIKISRIWADFFPANTSNQPI